MNARQEVLSKIKEETADTLKAKLKKREVYRGLMKKLIIQVSCVLDDPHWY
mgnify:FL=1